MTWQNQELASAFRPAFGTVPTAEFFGQRITAPYLYRGNSESRAVIHEDSTIDVKRTRRSDEAGGAGCSGDRGYAGVGRGVAAELAAAWLDLMQFGIAGVCRAGVGGESSGAYSESEVDRGDQSNQHGDRRDPATCASSGFVRPGR